MVGLSLVLFAIVFAPVRHRTRHDLVDGEPIGTDHANAVLSGLAGARLSTDE